MGSASICWCSLPPRLQWEALIKSQFLYEKMLYINKKYVKFSVIIVYRTFQKCGCLIYMVSDGKVICWCRRPRLSSSFTLKFYKSWDRCEQSECMLKCPGPDLPGHDTEFWHNVQVQVPWQVYHRGVSLHHFWLPCCPRYMILYSYVMWWFLLEKYIFFFRCNFSRTSIHLTMACLNAGMSRERPKNVLSHAPWSCLWQFQQQFFTMNPGIVILEYTSVIREGKNTLME